MDFLLNIVTFTLGVYLAFTNALAGEILKVLPESDSEAPEEETTITDGKLVELGTKSSISLPEILIKNATYQKAALVESIDPSVAPATALEALVNIYCTYKTDKYIKTTTGTGFFIDTDGVILTNAHVAQFLLLEGVAGDTQCTIRSGNPAKALYNAELLYISPAWVAEHAKLINEASPKGTGERDYALIYVTSGINGAPMPKDFPALPINTELLRLDVVSTEVFATGYPAEAMLEEGSKTPLIPKQATTTIAELMTFGSNLVDVFSIRGTSIGEHGSSGGPVVDANGNVIGMISTKGDDEKYGKGSLRAISLAYINRTIEEETTFSLRQNLSGNLPFKARAFKDTLIPFLQDILKEEL
ncbi:MAG: Trypsin-like peptidase domain [Candidatus Parcubacteria bacterium]|jgi:S1-C subfamily serine protease